MKALDTTPNKIPRISTLRGILCILAAIGVCQGHAKATMTTPDQHSSQLKQIGITVTVPDPKDSLSYTQAYRLYRRGDFNAAKEVFINLACYKPRCYPLRYLLANTYLRLRDYEDAKLEYETCLELYPDKRTALFCHKGIDYINAYTNSPPDEEGDRQYDRLSGILANQVELRRTQAAAKAEERRVELLAKAASNARSIREEAKQRLDELKENAPWPWFRYDYDNSRFCVIPDYVQSEAIAEDAESRAQKVLAEAQKRASQMTAPDTESIGEGLLSQTRMRGYSKTHLLPGLSDMYVRYYVHGNSNFAVRDPESKMQ